MKQDDIKKIQVIIFVIALIYIVSPDMLIGPIDDAAVAGIAGIVEVVLGIVNKASESHTKSIDS